MKRTIRQVALLGSYLPRQCGIATFTSDVYRTLQSTRPEWNLSVIALNDERGPYAYPSEVKFEIDQNVASYRRAGRYLTACEYDVLFVQHEFGLFGGEAGDMLFELLDGIRVPVVTMLHTVLQQPSDEQFCVLRRLAARSANVITMSPRGRRFLLDVYDIPDEKINVIPHGIPEAPFIDPVFYKEKFDLLGKQVALTFGLLSPGKGIENAIEALPSVIERHPDLQYLILGATHPNLVRQEGERYRHGLQQLATDLQVTEYVQFIDKFVDLEELVEYIGAADIYLTPYLNEAQITSGTLAYAYGCGNAVVSSPYWHACDLLADGRGRIVPFNDSAAIAAQINDLLDDEVSRHRMRKTAFLEGRQMVWPAVGERMATLIEQAHNKMFSALAFAQSPAIHRNEPSMRRLKKRANVLRQFSATDPRSLANKLASLVEVHLDYLDMLCDDVGLIQHATYNTPNRHEGYCTDDNIRGLLLMSLLAHRGGELHVINRLERLFRTFCNFAFDPSDGTIRNFLSYDRRWLEDRGSADCIGRVVWALGNCVRRAADLDVEAWAVGRFETALRQCLETTSPRSWSFGILGAAEYQCHFRGERFSKTTLCELATRLVACFHASSSDNWIWFEDILAYDNARIPHALLLAGAICKNDHWTEIGLDSLRWLCGHQKAPEGHFRPVGNQGFYQRNTELPAFDQQPLEAWATVSATLAAAQITGDPTWNVEADLALAWFLGCNDLRSALADVRSGACHDGLQFDCINRNQGAESTLSWLLAATEWMQKRGRHLKTSGDPKHALIPLPVEPLPHTPGVPKPPR